MVFGPVPGVGGDGTGEGDSQKGDREQNIAMFGHWHTSSRTDEGF
jgi:hypothetical protein